MSDGWETTRYGSGDSEMERVESWQSLGELRKMMRSHLGHTYAQVGLSISAYGRSFTTVIVLAGDTTRHCTSVILGRPQCQAGFNFLCYGIAACMEHVAVRT